MESYNVKEVAKMLNTSEETVRRWIRAGKLQATMKSRKEGRIITEAMLKEFVKATPKYAAALATPVGEMVAASALLFGTIITKNIGKNEATKHSKINSDEITKILFEQKASSKELIKKKQQMLTQLENEIKTEEEKIRDIDYLLKKLKREKGGSKE